MLGELVSSCCFRFVGYPKLDHDPARHPWRTCRVCESGESGARAQLSDTGGGVSELG